MTSVGTILKKEREKKKLSLSDISEETKIGIKYLKAIEADDYTIFPGETYIVGFIRNYARALGLDPLEIVSLYKSMKVRSPLIEKTQPSLYEEEEKEPETVTSVKPIEEPLKPRRRARKKLEKEPVEVVEIKEKDLPAPKLRRKKTVKPEQPQSLTPLPIKTKKFVNPIWIIVGVSVIVVLLLLGFLVKNIIEKITTSERKAIYTELSEIKYLEFERDVLSYDFAASEYYKIKLGDKFHTIMFEKLTTPVDVNLKESTTPATKQQQKIAFHFDDIILEMFPGEPQNLDFDLDGVKDIEVKINSINKDFFNASIKKLHPFIVAMTGGTNQTNIKSQATNEKAKSEKPEEEVSPPEKRKIVFEAIVRERTYIKAFLDGKEQEGKIYYPRDKIYLEANEVMQLKIGNAGGIVAKINGKPQKLGRRGEIANKVIKWEKDPYDESVYNLIIKDWQ